MKKRILSLLLCLAMLVAVFPALGAPAAAASAIPLGTYTNAEYGSSVTFRADLTFSFVMNFGEGFETVTGTYYTWEMDDGENVATLSVTSRHLGIEVYDTYNFSGLPQQNGRLYLTDGNAGIVPTETIFTLEAESGSSGPTDEQIAAGRAAIAAAVKSNNETLASEHKAAVVSGNTYIGYRGAALDSWAVKEVGIADAMDLMPTEVRDYFLETITREDFAALVYSALLRLSGITESRLNASVTPGSFPDTSDAKVGLCAGLGIITGYETGKFLPEKTITRQEAAAMLSRLAETIGAEATSSAGSFCDVSGLWGESYIKKVSTFKDGYTGNAVMGGTGGNSFSPFDSYSREQAVMTIVRMVGVSAGGTGVSSDEGSYEAVSSAVEAKVNTLGADGILSGDDIKAILDFAGTLEDQGLVTDLETYDSYVLYTTADGTPSGIVIDQETESEDGEPALGYGAADLSADVALTAADHKLYLENNNVLFISSFSKDDTIYNQPLLEGIEALSAKGYDVTVQNGASLEEYSRIGSGDYSMIFLVAHGIILGNQFYFCSEVNEKTAIAEEKYLIDGQLRIIDHIPVLHSGVYTFSREYYIAPAFFDNHLKSDPLDSAYVQFISCMSMQTESMANVFMSNGAKAVSGYTDIVEVSFAAKALKLTAEKLSPAVETTGVTETTVGELETSTLKTLGVNAFWISSYNTDTDTTERRAVLTRFVATGATDLVLAVHSDPKDLGEGLLLTGGTYYYKPFSWRWEYFEAVTIVNNTDQTIWGVSLETQYNTDLPTFDTFYVSDQFFLEYDGFPLKPGESATIRTSSPSDSDKRDCIVKYISGYTTVDPVKYFNIDYDIWVKLPKESYQLVRLVQVSAPAG